LASSAWGLAVGLACAAAVAGCTRKFFRTTADEEVGATLAEKDKYPAWKIEQYHVYPDPRARFADPSNPDRPPMPPDDPAAYDLSPCPQKPGKAGIAYDEGVGYLELLAEWDARNREATRQRRAAEGRPATEQETVTKPTGEGAAAKADPQNRPTKSPLDSAEAPPRDETDSAEGTPEAEDCRGRRTRPYRITLEQANELGLFNSREFQDRRENLYLAALPVTEERFSFAAQFYLLGQVIREHTGSLTTNGKQNDWTANTGTGFGKLFSTGALLLFRFANQTVVDMSGSAFRHTTSVSTINLDAIQPLLRGGGKAVTLEPLTQVERNLVYEIRSYARFRKEFYVSIAGGGGGSISGGVFVPTGVITATGNAIGVGLGTSGIIPGVIPPINTAGPGLQDPPGLAGRLNLNTAIPPNVSGFLGTLLQYAQIALDRANIANLQAFLELFEGFKEGGDVSQLQVDTVEQQLLTGRSNLLSDQQQYFDALDRFKLQLGLPTDIRLELDDEQLRPLNRQFQRYDEIFRQYAQAGKDASALGTAPATEVRAGLRRLFAESAIVRGTPFRERFPAQWAAWEKRTPQEIKAQLDQLATERRKLLDLKTDLETKGQTLGAGEQKRLRDIDFESDLGTFEQQLREYEARPWDKDPDRTRQLRQKTILFRFVLNGFVLVLGEARNERLAEVRRSWPEVPRLCVEGTDLIKASLDDAEAKAAQVALINRLDLMNVRGQLVDAWRQLAVFANALLGTFNVQYHLDSSTPTGRGLPFAFSGSRTRHQLILNWDLPLVRTLERNNYRTSLIAYQRQRRALLEAEDLVVQAVRGEIRQLRVLAEQYKIQQRQVELAYLTVESSLDTFNAPPAPVPAGGGGVDVSTRAATLTQQLLNAQTRLPLAQNQLLTVWINYVNTRFQLYRDLELMPLDQRGVWLDDIATCQCGDAGPQQPGTGDGAGQRPADADGRSERPVEVPNPAPEGPPPGKGD
jgi:hypothetical protein